MKHLKGAIHYFHSHLDEIANFLFQAENIDHPAVTPQELRGNRIQIQDNESRSYVCIHYADRKLKRVRAVEFCLNNEPSIIDRWIDHIVRELKIQPKRLSNQS